MPLGLSHHLVLRILHLVFCECFPKEGKEKKTFFLSSKPQYTVNHFVTDILLCTVILPACLKMRIMFINCVLTSFTMQKI